MESMKPEKTNIVQLLTKHGATKSHSAARRLVSLGAVTVDDEKAALTTKVAKGSTVKAGRKTFVVK